MLYPIFVRLIYQLSSVIILTQGIDIQRVMLMTVEKQLSYYCHRLSFTIICEQFRPDW